jgi:hypothetical protein
MNLKVRHWGAKQSQGLTWLVAGLGLLGFSFYETVYRILWIILGMGMLWNGQRLIKQVETPFERKQREMRRNQL